MSSTIALAIPRWNRRSGPGSAAEWRTARSLADRDHQREFAGKLRCDPVPDSVGLRITVNQKQGRSGPANAAIERFAVTGADFGFLKTRVEIRQVLIHHACSPCLETISLCCVRFHASRYPSGRNRPAI